MDNDTRELQILQGKLSKLKKVKQLVEDDGKNVPHFQESLIYALQADVNKLLRKKAEVPT